MIKTPPSYNLLMRDNCINTMRSPRVVPSRGNYIQRPIKAKISIYRNVSPTMKKPRYYDTMEPKTGTHERTINFDQNQPSVPHKNGPTSSELESKNSPPENFKTQKYGERIIRRDCGVNIKRSISHQITRTHSKTKNNRRNNFEPKIISNEPIKRPISPLANRERPKRAEFTSLSPEVKRRFGSVTVGKVVGKREIGRSQSKSSTILSKQSTLVKTPLRR